MLLKCNSCGIDFESSATKADFESSLCSICNNPSKLANKGKPISYKSAWLPISPIIDGVILICD